jgi:hypothetical protein
MKSNFQQFIANHFIDYSLEVPLLLPLKKKDDKYVGGKSNLSKEELKKVHRGETIINNDKEFKMYNKINDADCYELFLRHTENIICIDIDGLKEKDDIFQSKEFFNNVNLPDFLVDAPYIKSRTKKLPHIFIKVDNIDLSKLKNTYQDAFNCFFGDLLINHTWENPKNSFYNYDYLKFNKPIDFNNIINLLNDKTKKDMGLIEEKKEIITVNNDIYNCNNDNIIEKIEYYVNKMPNVFDTRDNWLKLCFIIFNETGGSRDGYDLFNKLSQKYKGYDLYSLNTTWYSSKKTLEKKLRLGTLEKMYYEIYPDEKKTNKKKIITVSQIKGDIYKSDKYIQNKIEFEKKYFKLNFPLKYIREEGFLEWKVDNFHEVIRDEFDYFEVKNSEISFFDLYRDDRNKRKFDKFVFEPQLNKHDPNNYNLFTGFEDVELTNEIINEDESYFLQLLKYITVTEDMYIYLKSWIAHIIQHPYKKTNTCIILYSAIGGIGKNCIVDGIVRLFGKYSGKIENIEDIQARFNSDQANKLFIYGDEICAKAKSLYNTLKKTITRTDVNVEKKQENKYLSKDYANWLFTTNEENAFKIEKSDRRFVPITCPDIPKTNEFYSNFYKEINDKIQLNKLFNFFLNYDNNGKYNIGIDRAPTNDYKQKLEYINEPAFKQMIYKDTNLIADRKLYKNEFYEMTIDYAKKHYLSSMYSITEFGKYMNKIFEKFEKASKGMKYFKLDNEIEVRKHLYELDKKYYKFVNNLPDDEEPNWTNDNDLNNDLDI